MTTTDPEAEARARARAHAQTILAARAFACANDSWLAVDAMQDALLTHERDLAAAREERDEARAWVRDLREALAGATEALDELGVMQEGSPLLALWREWVALAHPGTTAPVPKAEPHVCKCANDPCPVCGATK